MKVPYTPFQSIESLLSASKKLLVRFLCVVIVFMFSLLLVSPAVSADFQEEAAAIYGNRVFYQEGGGQCLSSSATGSDTYILGDSISHGLHLEDIEGQLSDKLGGETLVNYDGGRSITGAGSQDGVDPHVNALDAAENDQEFIKTSGVVIIVLGTSLGDDPFGEKMDELLNKLRGFAPSAVYYWVDIGANHADSAEAWSTRNQTIYEKSAAEDYSVISRYKALFGQDKDPLAIDSGLEFPGGGDQIHGGYPQLVEAILTAVDLPSSSPSTTSSSTCACQANTTNLTGSDNAERAFNFLLGKGLDSIHSAAIVGNMMRESSPDISPTTENSLGAYGIIQWLAGRRDALEAFAESQNADVGTLALQLDFLWHEANGAEAAAFESFLATSDVEEATIVFDSEYERSGDDATGIALRVDYATGALTLYGSNSPDTSSGDTVCVTNGNGDIVGGYSLPLDRSWFEDNPDWLTKPHHDYPAADLGVPEGTPVYSMSDGVIFGAGGGSGGGCGQGVSITGDDGLNYNYCHGSDGGSVEGAKVGDRVSAGQFIMTSSYTGRVIPPGPAGAHLHVGIFRGGINVCPQPLFQAVFNHTAIPGADSLPTSGCIGPSI